MSMITDPREIEEFMKNAEVADYSQYVGGGQTPSAPVAEDGSSSLERIGTNIKEFGKTALWAGVAANVSEKNSNYANRRLKEQAERLKESEQQLSTMESIAAGVGKYVPAIAAGIANPLAGAGIMGAMGTAESLVEQTREGLDPSMKRALAAGAVSGTVDRVTGGLGSKFLGKALPGLAERPVASMLTKAGTRLGEDAASAAAEQAAVNVSAEKDALQDVGTAALFGAGGGAVVRGALKGGQMAISPEAREAAKESIGGMFGGRVTPKDDFVDQVATQQARTSQLFDTIDTSADPFDIAKSIDELVSETSVGGKNAAAKALSILQGNGVPVTDAALGAHIPQSLKPDPSGKTLGEEMAGLSLADIRKAEQISLDARQGGFGTKADVEAGLTKREHEANIQRGYIATSQQLTGTFTNNRVKAEEIRDAYVNDGTITKGDDIYKDMTKMIDSLRNMEKSTQKISTRNKHDISEVTAADTKNFLTIASKLGLRNEFVDELGQAGRWNPLETMQTFNAAEILARSQMQNLHQGTPKERSKIGVGDVVDIGLLATGNIPAAIARRSAGWAAGKVGDMRSRSKLKGSIQKGSKRAQELESAIQAKLKSGDLAGAADLAGASLGSKDLAAKPTTERPRTRPLDEPVAAPVRDEPIRMEEASEAPREAPVAPDDAQAAKAQVAADLQEQIQEGTAKRGEPLKEKLRTVERPEIPKPKETKVRDLKGEAAIIKARSDNELIDRLIGNRDNAPVREDFLAKMGGLKGLRQKLADSTNAKESPEKFFNSEFKKSQDAQAKAAVEAREEMKKTEAKRKAEEKSTRDQETYEDDLKTILKRHGVSEENANIARKEYVGEGEPLTREKIRSIVASAKELEAKAEGKLKEAAEAQAKVDAEKMAKANLTEQRKKVTKALNAIKGAGAEFNAIKDSIQNQMKRATKSLTDAQLESIHRKIEDSVKAELKRLRTAHIRSGDEAAKDLMEKLSKSIGQSKETIDSMRSELEAARESAVRVENEAKKKAAAEARKQAAKEKSALDEKAYQMASDYGNESGLKIKETNQLREKATENGVFNMSKFEELVDQKVASDAAKQQKKFEEKFRGADEAELKEYAKDLVNEDLAAKATTAEVKAQLDALEAVAKEGKDVEVSELVRTYGDAMKLAKERKKSFPKNPELWLAEDTVASIQRQMGEKEGSTYTGNVYKRLRTKIYGTTKRRDLMSEEAIQEAMSEIAKGKGKLGEAVKSKSGFSQSKARIRRIREEHKK